MASSTWSGDGSYAAGSKRKKAYEWLKAANELGQTYTSRWTGQGNGSNEDYSHTPGAFPDVEIARSGDEEMVLFPSYARKLTPKKKDAGLRPRRDSFTQTIDEYRGVAEEDNFGSRWDEPEAENAVVDVDVRGWIYAPNRGPMNRKHRLMIKLARTLSGIPTPSGAANDEGPDRMSGKGEDEDVNRQVQNLVGTAEQDADQGWKTSNSSRNRVESGQPAAMTKDQISMANAHLMERLRPFLTNPMAGMPVTVFLFNDEQSESRNMMTDESGHFKIRAIMTFVPTHIRVLASEDLSAAKPIEIIEPVGISLISDIDDTVKHSAIASGAKEMFRNTFVRELAELKVSGVDQWYTQVAQKGVQIHYVSNAPWQLYPLLERYFKLAGLPPGSFHLKQYSGMLQGIFEPTAERKRGNLEQILRDFPERKFILVGDSGEADLEVYTDIALANPGRILGIFIRDVTTPEKKPFFEKSVGYLDGLDARSRSTPQLVETSHSLPSRPALPPRRPVPTPPEKDVKSIPVGDLIDLDDDVMETAKPNPLVKSRLPPTKPSKPSSLRTDTLNNARQPSQEPIRRKAVPPLPPRAASTAKTDLLVDLDPSPSISRVQTEPLLEDKSQTSAQSSRSKVPPPPPPPRRTNTTSSATSSASSTPTPRPAPAVPANKPSYPTSAAQAALSYATERLNLSSSPSAGLRQSPSNQSLPRQSPNGYNSYSASDSSIPPAPLPNKREELWRRRWERASNILETHGVVLGSWRVGSDAQPVCMWLIEDALKEIKTNGAGNRP
ncbi:hypothetical protein N7520_007533 [Penicillium odoratum]|uniref:uncharacterized protein n=1 Tax=Penicillium odoratum TaxID=1167516 RepID=UPI002548FBD6|nr:uncharacterized protein N7520_007533 [Penicillium odoratum]KAJ5760377.1 hypothetical protein N7520_007533 [Penicillium odoratum]